jgi:hypothetical protein
MSRVELLFLLLPLLEMQYVAFLDHYQYNGTTDEVVQAQV